jgi:uncharacterized protein YdeI (YjbR/CyaY-like superfamily)
MKPSGKAPDDKPIVEFPHQKGWAAWLAKNCGKSAGVWLRIAKKDSGIASVTYPEAVEVALCYGWIDGQGKGESDTAYLQKFTPRSKKSIWSKINRERALALIERGKMKPPGLAEIERAKADGRWEAAYDSPRTATVPEDFQAALDGNPRAKAFFATLKGSNRYAVLFRIQTAKKPETRARRIQQFIQMLEKHETVHS